MEKLDFLCFLEQILNRNQKTGPVPAEALDHALLLATHLASRAERADQDHQAGAIDRVDSVEKEAAVQEGVLEGKDEVVDLIEVDLPEAPVVLIGVEAGAGIAAAAVDLTANIFFERVFESRSFLKDINFLVKDEK